jgi:sugar lactone lactonase YvrE
LADVRTAVQVEPVGDVRAVLGEGPYWVAEDDCLLWVDISRGQLHRTYLPNGDTVTLDLEAASAVFPAIGGGLLTAGGSRLALHLPAERGGAWVTRVVAEAPARDGVRFNDAGVDPAGRVWVGSMHTDETEPLGELYRLGPGGELTTVLNGVTVSNGMGWSPDGTAMYYVDSPMRRIDLFDYDPATGEAFRRRVLADLSAVDGVPDGLTVDADGYVWVALWGGGALRRYAPDGTPDAVLPVPVSQPTSMAFGGPGLADLYVTTASIGLSEEQLAAQPLAGRLLRLRPGPIGLPSAAAYASLPA